MALKKYLILFICFFSSVQLVFGIHANFDSKTFYSGSDTYFIETHLNFIGGSMSYSSDDASLRANVQTLLILKKGEEIVDFVKVNIKSPVAEDSLFTDFMDLRRFKVQPGSYILELELKDLNDLDAEILTYNEKIDVPKYDALSTSDVIFLGAWQKTSSENDLSRSGYDMLPRVSNLFEGEATKLGFYAELYRTNKFYGDSSNFALATYVENQTTGEIIENTMKLKSVMSAEIIPVFQIKNIANLSEGIYNLVIDLRDGKNQTQLKTTYPFLKSAPEEDYTPFVGSIEETFAAQFTDKEQLYTHIESMLPKASNGESKTILNHLSSKSDIIELQSFFFNFWYNRNQTNPVKEWNNYYDEVLAVDKEFGTSVKDGFQTDRGQIYLKYGPPNTRVQRPHETGAHPFEIWHYYKADLFNNVKFVFYDRDQSINDYQLIHSNIRGEITNENFVDLILNDLAVRSLNSNTDVTNLNSGNTNGTRFIIEDLYLNPR